MKKNKTAIVLGGTSPHVKLIEKLKCRDYYTVLIDYLENSPGIAVADEHVRESTLDNEKVQEIVKEKSADLIISTCIDQANSTCCYVAEKLGLPHPYSFQTSLDVTNKGLMKKIMSDNDIPTSKYILVKSADEINSMELTYPVVVKPVDCNSSKGVHRADTYEETIRYVREALTLSRTHEAIVEGFNAGDEIQVDCIATNYGAEVIMSRQKQKIKSDEGMVLQSFGSVIPVDASEKLKNKMQEIAVKIAKSFGLHNTPFFYQAIVSGDEIFVLEFAPRIGGGLSYYLIQNIAGVDIIEAAIDSFLGDQIEFEGKNADKCYLTNLLYMNEGIFDHIEGLNELKDEGIIKERFLYKQKGDKIDSDMRSGNRVGAFIIEADNYEQLYVKARKALDKIKIIDSNGKDSLKREIYQFN
ncbi:MAG: ATP-grasp domain-containing protein [Candidatus Ornithomonoglobus sp.]